MGIWHAQYTGPQGGCDLIIRHKFRGAFKPLGTLFEVYNRYVQVFIGPDVLLTVKIITNLQQSCAHLHAFIHSTWSPSTINLVVSLNYNDACDSSNNVSTCGTPGKAESLSTGDQGWLATTFKTVQPSQFELHQPPSAVCPTPWWAAQELSKELCCPPFCSPPIQLTSSTPLRHVASIRTRMTQS